MSIAERFGAGVRDAREARGVSQAELARRIGMARQNYWSIESGRRVPSLEVVVAVADALGATLAELLQRVEDGR